MKGETENYNFRNQTFSVCSNEIDITEGLLTNYCHNSRKASQIVTGIKTTMTYQNLIFLISIFITLKLLSFGNSIVKSPELLLCDESQWDSIMKFPGGFHVTVILELYYEVAMIIGF